MDSNEQPPPSAGSLLRLRYTEIAARLGITPDAARQVVRRRGWQRVPSNRLGTPIVVVVPVDELVDEQIRPDRPRLTDTDESPSDNEPSPSTDPDGDRQTIAAQAAHITTLQAQLAHEQGRADRAETARDAVQTRLDGLRDRIEALLERRAATQPQQDNAGAPPAAPPVAPPDPPPAPVTVRSRWAQWLRWTT